jgi:hypothetical protein
MSSQNVDGAMSSTSAVAGKPTRAWHIDDLTQLGERDAAWQMRALPIFILERWITGGREEGVANTVSTQELVDRLVKTGVVTGYRSHDKGALLGSLTRMQRVRNLTDPPLLKFQAQTEAYWINLPHYEPLLQGYREWYRQRHPEDYGKLFPDGEPPWYDRTLPGREQ